MAKKNKRRTKAKSTSKQGAKAGKPPVKRPAASAKPAAKQPTRAGGRRQSWLDENGQKPLIDQYTRQLGTFIEAMADGVIEDSEVKDQEKRVVKLMREVEPTLDDSQHGKVTHLLCELTAYDIMQMLHAMHQQRPQVAFRG